jgi:hypothetical protein
MNIPRTLPQFKDRRALIITTGKQKAKLYLAYKGTLTEAASPISVPKPVYSDREGFFASRGGGVARSGSVYENKDEAIIVEFITKLRPVLKRLRSELGDDVGIYLAAPQKLRSQLEAALPPAWRNTIIMMIPGIHYTKEPAELLAMIQTRTAAPASGATTVAERRIQEITRRKAEPGPKKK